MSRKKSDLASYLELTPGKVSAKKAIVERTEELDVNLDECRGVDLDTAPVELLRGCARFVNDEEVRPHLPEQISAKVNILNSIIKFKENLLAGRYKCGDGTLEGCGNFCLKASGGIPVSCLTIIRDSFGLEGIERLETSHKETQETAESYQKKAGSLIFKTPAGEKIFNLKQIGQSLERVGQEGNVEAVAKGLDFLAAYGFVRPEDKEFAFKMVAGWRRKTGKFDFNECAERPDKCGELVPIEIKNDLKSADEMKNILREELKRDGIANPDLCGNEEYAERCLMAGKRAISKMEAVKNKSMEALNVIKIVQLNVESGERALEARRKAEEYFKKYGNIKIGEEELKDVNELSSFCEKNIIICLEESLRKGFITKSE